MRAFTETGAKITIEDQYEIKRGGEGKILSIPERPQQVAKIYLNKNYQHMSQAQKDALAVLDANYFVRPQELIYASKNKKNILGFTMEYLPPEFFPLSALFTKNFCLSNGIDLDFKLELLKQMRQAVAMAHQQQIIIGDLSGLNIMVNLQGQVKFIDVDAYETKVHTHWGLLLDEIRDYLYQGKVSARSDYFALAVVSFNLLSHLHPFKGIHKQYRSLAERMQRKLSVLSQDPQLIIPKCYTPLSPNNPLLKQYERIFEQGERFLIDLQSAKVSGTAPSKGLPVPAVIQSTLRLQEMYQPEEGKERILRANFTGRLGYLQTEQKTLFYDVSNQGYTRLLHTLPNFTRPIFVGEKQVFALSEAGKLQRFDFAQQQFSPISNFQLSAKGRYHQVGNILVVLDGEFMRFLHLDQVIKDQIHISQTPVFTPGFDTFSGLIQNVGGVPYIFYQSGENISTVRSPQKLLGVRVVGSVGLASYESQQQGETSLRHEYFSLDNLQMQLSGISLGNARHIAYKAQSASKGLIFEPDDNQLNIRRREDFQVLQQMSCDLLSTESRLYHTQAGIVAQEANFCYLLNTK